MLLFRILVQQLARGRQQVRESSEIQPGRSPAANRGTEHGVQGHSEQSSQERGVPAEVQQQQTQVTMQNSTYRFEQAKIN